MNWELPVLGCFNDSLLNEKLHGRVDLRDQVLPLGNRLVKVNWIEIDDHASHLGRVLITNDLGDMLEDCRADDLATILD